MLVDSHCHLDRLDYNFFQKNLQQLLAEAKAQGVDYFLCVSIDLETFPNVLAIAEEFPNVFASVGVHPTEALIVEPSLNKLIELAGHPKVIAIGETGLDYYRDTTQKNTQHQRFRTHIEAALKSNKPLIVHTRDAREDTIAILREMHAERVGGVLHCFTEDLTMAEAAIDLGFYISFSGILTFKNAKDLQEIAQVLPLNRILVETDSPYLAPDPYRGKPNQPAYVTHVAKKLAALKQTSFEIIAKETTANFFRLFKPLE